ncbi:MAG: flagellar type III secretion system pore protein FliP [Gemmatimonadota bacterium]
MTFAGYAGMLATLAFVLGLVLLVARLAKRFLPGAVQAAGGNTFAVVQRLPLGQRQGIAIVQRGDLLIGVSVGEGGVRTLFTMQQSANDAVSLLSDTEHATPVTPIRSIADIALAPPVAANAAFDAAAIRPHDISLGASFRKVLGDAMRGSALRALLLMTGALSAAVSLQAQAAPATPVPVTATPATTTAQQPGLRTLPPAAAQPGPRDLPKRLEPTVQAPRPSKPAATAAKNGGAAEFPPLLPAPQARDIAAMQKQAQGGGPLTTEEAQRIAGRADSMIAKLAPQMELKVGGNVAGEGLKLSGTVGVVIMMGLLSMLPVLILMMTGFTRILITLHFLKQALGTQSAPPGQLLAAMALLLSAFVMGPTLKDVNTNALEPWMEGKIEQVEMMSRAVVPFKAFMLRQVRDQDLQTFVDLAEIKQPESREAVPLTILMSAFVTSELRTAFQIGFALFLPFIVIDVVVGSVLMSMGMVMLPPALISMPFKLLLFVLVDGWGLVVTGLVQSFR